MMRIVLITGSRDWDDPERIHDVLYGAGLIITGDARGADEIAVRFARAHRIPFLSLHAWWNHVEKKAGSERNLQMTYLADLLSKLGYDIDCNAFPMPRSIGTWHCKRALEAVGLKVKVHTPSDVRPPLSPMEAAEENAKKELSRAAEPDEKDIPF